MMERWTVHCCAVLLSTMQQNVFGKRGEIPPLPRNCEACVRQLRLKVNLHCR